MRVGRRRFVVCACLSVRLLENSALHPHPNPLPPKGGERALLREHHPIQPQTIPARADEDERFGGGGDEGAERASKKPACVVMRFGVGEVLVFFDEDVAHDGRERRIGAVEEGDLFDQMLVHRALDGGGADINAGASARGGERAEGSAAERPHEHQPARLSCARRHGFAEARAMTLFVRERFFKPGDEIRMAPARMRKLRRINRHRAMLASVIYAQDAGDEAGHWRDSVNMACGEV